MRRVPRAGVPCPRWAEVTSRAEAEEFAARAGWPIIMKTSRGGYDGKGVWRAPDADEAARLLQQVTLTPGAAWLAEELIDFTQELAAQVARSPHGQAVAYPVVRTTQSDGVCAEVVAPAPGLTEAARRRRRDRTGDRRIARVVGMLAVELFDTGDRLLVNELAMRPTTAATGASRGRHLAVREPPASGAGSAPGVTEPAGTGRRHDQHPRKYPPRPVSGVPSGDGTRPRHQSPPLRQGGARAGKVGHVTAIGEDVDALLERARHAADFFMGVIDG